MPTVTDSLAIQRTESFPAAFQGALLLVLLPGMLSWPNSSSPPGCATRSETRDLVSYDLKLISQAPATELQLFLQPTTGCPAPTMILEAVRDA